MKLQHTIILIILALSYYIASFACLYETLEIPCFAPPEKIKTSYRRLALKYHPDKNKENTAEAKFKEINNAYKILTDIKNKEYYDRYKHPYHFNYFKNIFFLNPGKYSCIPVVNGLFQNS